jgi:lysophospholipase L1-like esterase
MNQPATPQALVIVFMGDSITGGQYVEPSVRWTALVGDAIVREYLSTPVNFNMLVRGVSGETTRQGLERFPNDLQQYRPDIVTLQFGLNDCNCWVSDAGLPRVSEAAYRANLAEMIERAQRFGARVILSTNHPTLRHKVLLSGESLEQRRLRYNDIVREVAASSGAELCDMEQAFAAFDYRELAEMLLPYPDQLHLSVAGHRHYANYILPRIRGAISSLVVTGEARLVQK